MREDELLAQFHNLIDKVDLDKTGMRKKLEAEVERMNKFTADVLGVLTESTIPKMDVRGYAEYVLKDGKIRRTLRTTPLQVLQAPYTKRTLLLLLQR